jgi:N-acyl-L-homoserine lactone synthetase
VDLAQSIPEGVLRPGIHLARNDEDRSDIFRFRYDVYVERQGKSLRAADHLQHMIRDDMDDWGYILYAKHDGRIVGTVCVNMGVHRPIPERYTRPLHMNTFADFDPSTWSISLRLMIERRRRLQVLLPLLQSVYAVGRTFGSRFNFLYCSPHLVHFFQRLGFRQHASAYEDEEVGLRIPMVLVLEDTEHMERVRSPFLEEARKRENSLETSLWFSSHVARPC